ncbi:MGDG synthase family glycosyltransferase [Romboutsia lituseburensis]|uniref:MGDG synthase family glycosyltransferase n=1 Tax=Romboutsia lituseburensis TaxID=1537 RepID=UPI00215A1CA4|nr:glycosyltransferase [Romboutsia lituseburensis]MCR8746893.1 hypothetical protein [Romboutsia lituseburensis]
MNILILTASFGMGHNSSAVAIKQELSKKYSDSKCFIVDINKYMFPVLHEVIYKGFNVAVHKCHNIYNSLYKISQKQTRMPLKGIFMKKVHDLLDEYNPNIVISTLPMSSKLISEYKMYSNCDLPLITCITDVSVHSSWINPKTNIYFVSSQTSKEKLLKKGILEEKIFITGIPVKEDFIKFNDRPIDPNIKKILVMGGGLGIIPFDNNLYKELNGMKNVEVTIITGKNKKVFNKLNGKYSNINVIDYCENVHEYMQASDIIISKPGGITLFEAIHSKLPMFVICPFLEQEIENAYFIEKHDIGKVIWNKDSNLSSEINDLLNNEGYLYEVRDKMKNIQTELNKIQISSILDKFNIPRAL